jgi:hypothetical protein
MTDRAITAISPTAAVSGDTVLGVHSGAVSSFTVASLLSNTDFVPAGTGAATRTLQAKQREAHVSVLDYGADATGVADSATAFTNAKTAASAGGKVLYVPAGTYKITTLTWDKDVELRGAGRNSTVINVTTTTTHGLDIQGDSGITVNRLRMSGFTLAYTGTGQAASKYGINIIRKVILEDVYVKNFTSHGIYFDGTDTSQAPYFSELRHVWSKSNGGDGCRVRNNTNAIMIFECQFDKNTGVGFHHLTDGSATYGSTIIGGQACYNGSYGWHFESGTNLTVLGIYHEQNGCSAPGNNATAYVTTSYDVYVGDNVSRSLINVGTVFNNSNSHVRAPAKGLNDGLGVFVGADRIYGSTSYHVPVQGGTVASVSTANASDLATAIALANANKTAINALIVALQASNALT